MRIRCFFESLGAQYGCTHLLRLYFCKTFVLHIAAAMCYNSLVVEAE